MAHPLGPEASREPSPRAKALAARLRDLTESSKQVVAALSAAVKRIAATGSSRDSDPEFAALQRRLDDLSSQQEAVAAALQAEIGVTDAELDELEGPLPSLENRLTRRSLVDVPPTAKLDSAAGPALERLMGRVDPKWLESQRGFPYRLMPGPRTSVLQVAGGVRVAGAAHPQRFAHALLVTDDFVHDRQDMDCFAAALLVPELVMLGQQLEVIGELGPVAEEKLRRLPEMPDDLVASTVYELLVGAACVRIGLHVEMLEESPPAKSPDFRVRWPGPPTVIECKRKGGPLGPSSAEASHVFELWNSIQEDLDGRGLHPAIDVEFSAEVDDVPPETFRAAVRPLLESGELGEQSVTAPWGRVASRALSYADSIPRTRLFSPDFLSRAFGWSPDIAGWDGLVCKVESPASMAVSEFRNPRCLRWKVTSQAAVTRKARGISGLLADAISQVPDGEMGVVYISYVEGNREELADARTEFILESIQSWRHRWSVVIPLLVLNRLYPRPLGDGRPDLIDNAVPCFTDDGSMRRWFPACVFTPPPS